MGDEIARDLFRVNDHFDNTLADTLGIVDGDVQRLSPELAYY